MKNTIGIMFRCQLPPEQLVASVQAAERAGLDEFWVVEDCFYAGALASATTALARTERITVGIGIIPAVSRNPAFTAMELSALSRLYPGRVLPGLGHGVGEWMKQIGAFPTSQLAALEETTLAVRALLAGESVTTDGQHVHLDDVKLEFPPEVAPPISLGVRGPKSLALSGRSADGTILAEFASPAYVRWAKEQIAAGQAEANRIGASHRLTVYALCAMDTDRAAGLDAARAPILNMLSDNRIHVQLAPMGVLDEIEAMKKSGTLEVPDSWVEQLAVAGTSDDCVAAINRLYDAGADTVVLVPVADDQDTLTRIEADLLPLLRDEK